MPERGTVGMKYYPPTADEIARRDRETVIRAVEATRITLEEILSRIDPSAFPALAKVIRDHAESKMTLLRNGICPLDRIDKE